MQFISKLIARICHSIELKIDTGTDDFAALQVVSDAKASLHISHGKGELSDYPRIKILFETAHLISPHNMNVESGFSTKKSAESPYRTNLACETYDALRLCKTRQFEKRQFRELQNPLRFAETF